MNRLRASDQLNRAGFLPEFIAGLLAIIGNLEAILFYIWMLRGFFEVTSVTTLDIVVVGTVSAAITFCGNIILAAMPDRASLLIASQSAPPPLCRHWRDAFYCAWFYFEDVTPA